MAFEVIEAPAPGPVRRGLLAPGGSIDATPADSGGQQVDGMSRAPRWAGPLGFSWNPVSCAAADPLPIVCPSGIEKPDDSGLAGDREMVAVALFGVDRCRSTLSADGPRVPEATANLLATQSWQLAREFWDGVASLAATPDLPNPFLAKNGEADVLGSSAFPYANALAALDHELRSCLHGSQGMIHATSYTVTMWQEAGLLHQVDGSPLLLTPSDNIVVTDAGYSGSAPATAPGGAPVQPVDIAASAFVYGTGLVYHLLGPTERIGRSAAQEIDRDTNDLVTRVERPAAAMWSGCCTLGIEVDHTTAVGPAA